MNPDLYRYPITFPTLGWQIISWIEAYLVHGPGDVQSQPFELDDEECAWICHAYRLFERGHERAGRRMIHRGVYVRAKGMRKTELGGAICAAEIFGPVRFDGWDAKGDPVGKAVTYPWIRVIATEEEQSNGIFDNVTYMLANGRAADEYRFDLGRSAQTSTRIYIDGGGEVRPSTSGDASKDGGKESFVAADETHLMNTPQLRRMYRTVARNTGKRIDSEPWIAEFTTAWQPGESSIAEQVADQWANVPYEEAELKGVLFDHRQGETPRVFGSDTSLKKAIRSAYAPFKDKWTDFDRIVRIIRDSEDPEAEAHRYFLSIPRAGASTWLYPAEVDAVLGDVVHAVRDSELITLGFDGSESDDHTVLSGCRENGDLFTVGAWTPDAGDYRWRDEVMETIEWCFRTFTVVRAYLDPPYWQAELSLLIRRHGSPPVVDWWTNVDSKMAVATGALRSAIRNTEDPITIDPEPIKTDEQHRDGRTLVAWHMVNARTRKVKVRFEDRMEEAFVCRKERPGSAQKIDSVPSMVLARRARDDAIKAGEWDVPTFARAAW